jgi:hypothetical protein
MHSLRIGAVVGALVVVLGAGCTVYNQPQPPSQTVQGRSSSSDGRFDDRDSSRPGRDSGSRDSRDSRDDDRSGGRDARDDRDGTRGSREDSDRGSARGEDRSEGQSVRVSTRSEGCIKARPSARKNQPAKRGVKEFKVAPQKSGVRVTHNFRHNCCVDLDTRATIAGDNVTLVEKVREQGDKCRCECNSTITSDLDLAPGSYDLRVVVDEFGKSETKLRQKIEVKGAPSRGGRGDKAERSSGSTRSNKSSSRSSGSSRTRTAPSRGR